MRVVMSNLNFGPMICPLCGSVSVTEYGKKKGRVRYKCRECKKEFEEDYSIYQIEANIESKFDDYEDTWIEGVWEQVSNFRFWDNEGLDKEE